MSGMVERNNELFPAVCAGDHDARDEMIVSNMGLVVVKAASLVNQIPGLIYLRDDLVSAGHIGLVRAVDRIKSGRVRMAAVNRWIGRSIEREMWRLLPHEHSIHIPAESSRLARSQLQPIESPVVYNTIPEHLEAHSELRLVELRDVMAACCHTEAERQCLRLRVEGHTFQEIGDRLDVPRPTAARMFHRLKNHILAYWTTDDPRSLS
jgi:RNA polymerase sigma factor (sigma-70 family)